MELLLYRNYNLQIRRRYEGLLVSSSRGPTDGAAVDEEIIDCFRVAAADGAAAMRSKAKSLYLHKESEREKKESQDYTQRTNSVSKKSRQFATIMCILLKLAGGLAKKP